MFANKLILKLFIHVLLVASLVIPSFVHAQTALEAPRSPIILPSEAPVVIEFNPETTEDVEDLIIYYADKYDVRRNLALAIADCESDLNEHAKNPYSTASGVFQFLNSTWEKTMWRMGYSTFIPKNELPLSVEAGIFLLAQDGTRHWLESKSCWSKKIGI